MEKTTAEVNGEIRTIHFMSFDKFCVKFYSYLHECTIAAMQEDYESARTLCETYNQMGEYNDMAFCNYSFYKTVLLYITSQSPCISSMYDVYKADRLKGNR